MRGRRPGNGRRGSRMGVIEIFTRPDVHPVMRVIGAVVRYRAELSVTTVMVVGALVLREQIEPDWTTFTIVSVAAAVLAVPASRRYVTRRVWCVYARHRARACFVQTRTMTYDGRMPFLYWSRPSPVGERIRVWLPAGLSVKHIEQACEELAAACWARTARVEAHRRWAMLAVVEIVRRDPLGAADIITPAVLGHIDPADHPLGHTAAGGDDAAVEPLPNRTALPTPAPRDDPPSRSRRNPTVPRPRDAEHQPGGAAPVTGFGGVDVSDYV